MVAKTKEAVNFAAEYRRTSCGVQGADPRPAAGSPAPGLGDPIFSDSGADRQPDAGGLRPFALGCVAACGPGAEGIAALLGAGVGAVLFLDFAAALPFLAAAILIFTTAAAFQG